MGLHPNQGQSEQWAVLHAGNTMVESTGGGCCYMTARAAVTCWSRYAMIGATRRTRSIGFRGARYATAKHFGALLG